MPQTKKELEAEIAQIEIMLEENDAALRTLLTAEDPQSGVFYAQDIHNLRQKKMVLLTRKQLREVRIKRLAYMDDDV